MIKQLKVNLKQTFSVEFIGKSFLQLACKADSNNLVQFYSTNSTGDNSICWPSYDCRSL